MKTQFSKVLGLAVALAVSQAALAGDFFDEADKAIGTKEKTPVLVKLDNKTKKPVEIVALRGISGKEVSALKNQSDVVKEDFVASLEKDNKAYTENTLKIAATRPDSDRATSAWYGWYWGGYSVWWTTWYTVSWTWYVPRYTYVVYWW